MTYTFADYEQGAIAYLLVTRKYDYHDQVAAARADFREHFAPKALEAAGELPEEWQAIALATADRMLKALPKEKRTNPVALGALTIAGLLARAHVKAALQRTLISNLRSDPEFGATLKKELLRV